MSDADIDPATTPLSEWLDRLAGAQGAPGGGAASAVMAAMAAALLGMVAGYTPDDPRADAARERLARIRRSAAEAAEEDGRRSAGFGAALAMDDGDERERAVREATVDAIASAIEIGTTAGALVDEVDLLGDIGNPNVDADLRVAVAALRAALDGVEATARASLDLLARHRADDDGLDDRVADFERDLECITASRDELDARR